MLENHQLELESALDNLEIETEELGRYALMSFTIPSSRLFRSFC